MGSSSPSCPRTRAPATDSTRSTCWIKTVPFSEADGPLKRALEAQHALYPREYERKPGDESESIVSTHALIPDALYHASGVKDVKAR
jgi:hypothetical protein